MTIDIKKASIKDSSFFFLLRNEKEALKNSFNSNSINLKNHNYWMKKQLKDKKNIFLIAKKNSEAFGVIRYNLNNMIAHISINIAKKFRNLGYGSTALKYSEKFLKESLIVIAEVKKGNKGSLNFFKKNKYEIFSKKKYFILIKIIKR
mgnify:FL=1|jgi:ribosomal protein S18 acetylase RimI-like enzyme|tara:strand:- start:50 stop:493 length:444 start_codon:yes stop_codon:yes gene_type:complete